MDKKKNSRKKGSSFELDVAKAFSETLGVELRRTPLSGGWSHSNPAVAGDLVCMNNEIHFPYCVECKNSEGWTLDSLFTDKHKWFDDWWAQAIGECPEDKVPLLIFTKNRSCALVAMYASHIGLENVQPKILLTDQYHYDLVVCRLEAFLEVIANL